MLGAFAPHHIELAVRAEAAFRNGALSGGPVTPKGKARSALNATCHGLCSRTVVLGAGENVAKFAVLRAALLARWQPVDTSVALLVEERVFAAWRQVRLRAVEDAVLARAEAGEAPSPALPSLITLIRYRGRIERDARAAAEQLAALRGGRKDVADPSRLRRAAERIEQAQAMLAAAGSSTAIDTNEPSPPDCTNEFGFGTHGPDEAERTNDSPPCMNEPRYPVPPLAVARAEALAAAANRHERRRLAALARRGLRNAARGWRPRHGSGPHRYRRGPSLSANTAQASSASAAAPGSPAAAPSSPTVPGGHS
jgi:hypothetical protein